MKRPPTYSCTLLADPEEYRLSREARLHKIKLASQSASGQKMWTDKLWGKACTLKELICLFALCCSLVNS